MRILRAAIVIWAVLMCALGAAFCAFPYIEGNIKEQQIQQEVNLFKDRLETMPTEPPTSVMETSPREHEGLWNDMVAYNQHLLETEQSGLTDPWAYQQSSFRLKSYGFNDEVFGLISIPKLDVELPIYLGATDINMAAGAAHLSQTSLPIGGENTNCVIAGHRGYGAYPYFRYIAELQAGDEVIITNLWETLRYTVTDTKIIQPNEVNEILIQEGREILTLLTCHPYASGGKQRYLVYCDRVVEEVQP